MQQVGRYTKVGNLVTIVGYLSWSSHTGTGSMIMRGYPILQHKAVQYIIHWRSWYYASGITLGSGYTQFNMYYPTYSSNDYIEFYKTGSCAVGLMLQCKQAVR